jgi:hypothetical protein
MSLLARLGALAAGIAAGILGMFLVLPFGLIASEYVIFALALGVAGLFAALGAGWAANLLAGDGTRTRLQQVALATELAAALIAILFLTNSVLRVGLLGPVLYIALACGISLGLVAAVAAWRFRSTDKVEGEVRLTVLLLVLAVVSVPVAIFLASLAGLTGA